jgi:dUTP pyrophosphatase
VGSLKIKKVRNVITPNYGHSKDAGLDFYIPEECGTILAPGDSSKIPSGIIMDIPEGWMGLFLNKSSGASQLDLLVGAQVIDHGYTGEVHLCLHNVGNSIIRLTPGMKVVQMVFIEVMTPLPIIVDAINSVTGRDDKGFGSTGGGYDYADDISRLEK